MLKRSALLLGSLVTAIVGTALLLFDVWVVVAAWTAKYRRWPIQRGNELDHPWLWLVVLPLAAILLLFSAYRLRGVWRHLGEPASTRAPRGTTAV